MISLQCGECGSEGLIRDGKSSTGKQRYRCRGCGKRSSENPYRGRPPEKDAQIVALLHERVSQRGIARALKVSRVTVAQMLKKTPSS